jgi:lipoprotein-releasing system ATP-binding protein
MSSKGLNIVLRAVDKTFKKGAEQIQVLRQLDLEIVAGESLTILGASGVGKSTLLYLIGTLEHPDGGELLIDGKSIFTQPLSQLAAFRNLHMGFIFQFHHLLKDFDAQENVAMPLLVRGVARRLAMDKAAEMLQQVGLGKRLNHRSGEKRG